MENRKINKASILALSACLIQTFNCININIYICYFCAKKDIELDYIFRKQLFTEIPFVINVVGVNYHLTGIFLDSTYTVKLHRVNLKIHFDIHKQMAKLLKSVIPSSLR